MTTHYIKDALFSLLPERAILWQEEKCILISDLHLGKVDHFRKNGIPIPEKASVDNYVRFHQLLSEYQPRRVIVLGDLFHSEMNQNWGVFKEFVLSFPSISFELVKGNHDILGLDQFLDGFSKVYPDVLKIGPFSFSHYPMPEKGYYNFSGHVHPAIKVVGKGRQSVSLSCFAFAQDHAILPAFGTFTGRHHIEASQFTDLYVIADQEIIRFN